VQKHVETVQCILQGPGKGEVACAAVSVSLEVYKANCMGVGRDILTPFVESSYPATRCTLCEAVSGQIRYVSQVGLLQCEEVCSQDLGCRGFDFDTLRSYCRTWSACPSRSNLFGCQWTVYERPASEYQTSTLATTEQVSNETDVNDNSTKGQATAVSAAVLHRTLAPVIQSVLLLASLGSHLQVT